jgi:hypothetical protein
MENTFIGAFTGEGNTTGIQNTCIGAYAGGQLNTGTANTFIGYNTGIFATGNSNTFIGKDAGKSTSTGEGNVFVGGAAGISNTTGGGNVYIGMSTGFANFFANHSVYVGQGAKGTENMENGVAIGYNSTCSTDHKVRIGNSSMLTIEGQVAYSFPSDGRFKFNVEEKVPGLDFIQRLRPVTYQFDLAKYNQHIQPDRREENADAEGT